MQTLYYQAFLLPFQPRTNGLFLERSFEVALNYLGTVMVVWTWKPQI
jgi:hypothetical protein